MLYGYSVGMEYIKSLFLWTGLKTHFGTKMIKNFEEFNIKRIKRIKGQKSNMVHSSEKAECFLDHQICFRLYQL